MSFLKSANRWFERKSSQREPIQTVQDTKNYNPGKTYVVVNYQPGQKCFIHTQRTDEEAEREVLTYTKLQDSSIVTEQNFQDMRECPNCRRMVIKDSLKECLNRGCYQIVCKVCSPTGLCRTCRMARFWGIE